MSNSQTNQLASNTSGKKSGSTTPAFLEKLFDILEDNSPYSHLISWQPDGTSFIIKKVNEFSETVLPKYFKHSNIQSYIRQLNMYGFSKTRHDSNHREFTHKLFQRNRRDLLPLIKRKSHQPKLLTTSGSATQSTNVDSERNNSYSEVDNLYTSFKVNEESFHDALIIGNNTIDSDNNSNSNDQSHETTATTWQEYERPHHHQSYPSEAINSGNGKEHYTHTSNLSESSYSDHPPHLPCERCYQLEGKLKQLEYKVEFLVTLYHDLVMKHNDLCETLHSQHQQSMDCGNSLSQTNLLQHMDSMDTVLTQNNPITANTGNTSVVIVKEENNNNNNHCNHNDDDSELITTKTNTTKAANSSISSENSNNSNDQDNSQPLTRKASCDYYRHDPAEQTNLMKLASFTAESAYLETMTTKSSVATTTGTTATNTATTSVSSSSIPEKMKNDLQVNKLRSYSTSSNNSNTMNNSSVISHLSHTTNESMVSQPTRQTTTITTTDDINNNNSNITNSTNNSNINFLDHKSSMYAQSTEKNRALLHSNQLAAHPENTESNTTTNQPSSCSNSSSEVTLPMNEYLLYHYQQRGQALQKRSRTIELGGLDAIALAADLLDHQQQNTMKSAVASRATTTTTATTTAAATTSTQRSKRMRLTNTTSDGNSTNSDDIAVDKNTTTSTSNFSIYPKPMTTTTTTTTNTTLNTQHSSVLKSAFTPNHYPNYYQSMKWNSQHPVVTTASANTQTSSVIQGSSHSNSPFNKRNLYHPGDHLTKSYSMG